MVLIQVFTEQISLWKSVFCRSGQVSSWTQKSAENRDDGESEFELRFWKREVIKMLVAADGSHTDDFVPCCPCGYVDVLSSFVSLLSLLPGPRFLYMSISVIAAIYGKCHIRI